MATAANRGPSASRRYGLLALLTLIVTANYVDRYVLSIMAEPIRKALMLSDTQLGLLTGAGFALLYTTLAIPVARLAERHNRVIILTAAVVIWSLATASCGLAAGFAALFVCRALVGLGEAGAMAPSLSMLSDVFPVKSRGAAMGVFGLGGALGGALAPLIGGWLQPAVGWRDTFLYVGLAGMPMAAVLAIAVREPPRGQAEGLSAPPAALPFAEATRRLLSRPAFALLIPALCLMALGEYSMILWMPAFFGRTFGMATGDVGRAIAGFQGAPFFLGTLAGGLASDRLCRIDPRWIAWLPGIGALLTAPTILALFAMRDAHMALLLLVLPSFVNGLYIAPSYAAIQNLSAVHSRATATAILTFAVNLVGAGLGPFLLGALSQVLAGRYGEQSLRYAFFSLAPLYLAAAGMFGWMSLHVRRDLQSAEADSLSTVEILPA